MKLIDAMNAAAVSDEPQPISAGRCEFRKWYERAKLTGYCGKGGRWLVRGQIRCGEHKNS